MNNEEMAIAGALVVTIFSLVRTKKYVLLFDLFRPYWIFNFIIVVVFTLYILTSPQYDTRIQDAVKKGFLALIIAVCSEVHLSITPFWLVFVASYYLEGWA